MLVVFVGRDPLRVAPTKAPDPDVSSSSHIDIVIVDDHPTTRSTIRRAAEETMGMKVVGETGSATEAFALIEEHEPAVATVDLSLDDGHGLDLLENVRNHCPETRTVVFSMYDEKVYAERAFRAGASGYLMKASAAGTLVEAIRQVNDGEVYLSPEMTSRVLKRMVKGEAKEAQFPIDSLTDRELQVFQMMGHGLTVEEITERLNLARKTVETHRRHAKEKLGVDSVSELMSHAARWTMAHAQEAGEGKKDPR